MEKERKTKMISLAALIVAVLGLTVAFAAMSQTLTINGTASLNAAEWDIHFENLREPEIKGDASATNPTLSGTTISGFDATVTKPGDKVVFTFDIVNKGTINAEIEYFEPLKIYITKLISTGGSGITEEEKRIYDLNGDGKLDMNDFKKFTMMIKTGLYYEDEKTIIKAGDTLAAGETKTVKLVVEYLDTATELPSEPMKIYDNATAEINYIQAD